MIQTALNECAERAVVLGSLQESVSCRQALMWATSAQIWMTASKECRADTSLAAFIQGSTFAASSFSPSEDLSCTRQSDQKQILLALQ